LGGGAVGQPLPQPGNCSDSQQLIMSVDHSEHLSVSSVRGFRITNTASQTFGGTELNFFTTFTSFNSGGPSVGISIDNPVTESASFSSSVSGPGVGDSHACNTTNPVSPFNFTSTTCGVPSPDFSQDQFGISLAGLGPGLSEDFLYTTNIVADFSIGVPEPSSLVIIGPALLLGLGGLFLRRSMSA